MSYKKEVIYKHLENYKHNRLKILNCGTWNGNGKEYPHILPNKMFEKNIIASEYGEIKDIFFEKYSSKKHSCFHHLNSSQALAFNLFAPVELERNLQCILKMLGFVDDIIDSGFEHIENPKENTNFDFYIEGKERKYFFEVKYTEGSFGSTKNDKNHQEKYERIYKDDIESLTDIDRGVFFSKYQLWRNIVYAKNGNIVVFVFPRFRLDLFAEIQSAKNRLRKNAIVRELFIEDICKYMLGNGTKEARKHYTEFNNKYLKIENI